jgi:hypothetical protein
MESSWLRVQRKYGGGEQLDCFISLSKYAREGSKSSKLQKYTVNKFDGRCRLDRLDWERASIWTIDQ